MAPALTQTGEPPNLADTTCHTPDSSTNTPITYDNLKELSKNKNSQDKFFESKQILLSNGDFVSSGLAPPACGWAEGRPVPNTLPCRSNMDEQSSLSLSNSGNTRISLEEITSQPVSSNSNMGIQTYVTNIDAAAAATTATATASEKSAAEALLTFGQDDSTSNTNNQNELLALVGRDFANVNEIIDTLQRLASNPELLDAAARDMEPEGSATQNAPQNQSPEDRASFDLARLAERHRQLERRRLFLLRRLRRVTARGLGVTVSSQLSYLTRHIGRVLEEERSKLMVKKVEEPMGLELLHKESMKQMSTSDLISLVRRVEASNNLQRQNDIKSKRHEVSEVLTLPSSICAELDTVASEMRGAVFTHISHDSDATESSSGGESCDESDVFNTISTSYKPIRERAFNKFCRTRGWVASKWMWLQAQIADLDYKILQQQKIHAHIRKSKGAVTLAEETHSLKNPPPPPLRNPAHMDMQDPALTCIGTPLLRTILNGYHPSNKIEEMSSIHGYANGHEFASGCARTLGIQKVKRRRYVKPNVIMLKQSLGIIPNSTNNVKVSPILCKCVPPLTCILCIKSRTYSKNNVICFGGSSSNSSKLRSIFSSQTFNEKLSKTDQAFHPVLSRHTGILQGELYSTVIKSSEWQRKALINKPSTHRESIASNSDMHLEPLTKRRRKDKEHKRNGRRKHSKEDGKERIMLKFKKSILTDALEHDCEMPEIKRRKYEMRNTLVTRRNFNDEVYVDSYDESGSWQVSMSGSAHPSPCPSPALPDRGGKGDCKGQMDLRNRKQSTGTRQKQNSTSNSYDIDNIVIPYSMAAASRVELIQYKEIPTPKWRIEEIQPVLLSSNIYTDEEIEDVSDEAITVRHSKCEVEEHKKFLQYIHTQPNSSRSYRSRRADSSGTNTPDHPLSPRPSEPLENSPVGSPPDTPLTQLLGSSENATVLTLSLSSLQSSLLKSNLPSTESEENCSSSSNLSSFKCQPNTSSAPSNCASEGLPALRTRRSLSSTSQSIDKLRSSSFNEEQFERERISPFPSRSFPLKENEYQDLVCENQCLDNGTPSDQVLTRSGLKNEAIVPSIAIPVHQELKEDTVSTRVGTDEESGRDSPLSELTDSAPEEEGTWDEGASPDWTISAVNDRCGGFVLTVQKN